VRGHSRVARGARLVENEPRPPVARGSAAIAVGLRRNARPGSRSCRAAARPASGFRHRWKPVARGSWRKACVAREIHEAESRAAHGCRRSRVDRDTSVAELVYSPPSSTQTYTWRTCRARASSGGVDTAGAPRNVIVAPSAAAWAVRRIPGWRPLEPQRSRQGPTDADVPYDGTGATEDPHDATIVARRREKSVRAGGPRPNAATLRST
jgi:hypothetical protein